VAQVADVIRQRGYFVKHVDTRFKFVSFSTIPLPTDGEVVTAGANPADLPAADTSCALIGDTADNTPLYASGSNAARCAAGIQPTFPGPKGAVVAVAADAASDVTIQSITMAIPGAIVEEDVPVYLLNGKMQQADDEASIAAAAEPAQSKACSPGPDGAIGKTVEEVPYGESLLQVSCLFLCRIFVFSHPACSACLLVTTGCSCPDALGLMQQRHCLDLSLSAAALGRSSTHDAQTVRMIIINWLFLFVLLFCRHQDGPGH
jgi:hypothetical protein